MVARTRERPKLAAFGKHAVSLSEADSNSDDS